MDKDSIFKIFQEICRWNPVIILGSGASCAAGIPGMPKLAEHLLTGMEKESGIDWRRIRDDLRGEVDLETALQNNPPNDDVQRKIICIVGRFISENDHGARERFFKGQLTIPIEGLIDYYRFSTINIITPNYDCFVEYCCDKLRIPCKTGFTGYYRKALDFEKAEREMAYIDVSVVKGKRRKVSKVAPHINLFKVHGSIDWYSVDNEVFSDAALTDNEEFDVMRQIILPGYRKYYETIKDPYRELIQKADDSIKSGRSFLMIGYGFNDEDLEEKLVQRLRDDEQYGIIITMSLSDNAKKMFSICPNLWGISRKDSSTLVHHGKDVFEIPNSELWRIDEFVKHVLGE